MLGIIRILIVLMLFAIQVAKAQPAKNVSIAPDTTSTDSLYTIKIPKGNLYMTGIYFYNQKLYIQALEYFEQIDTSLLPQSIHYLRGNVHQNLGNYNLAKQEYLLDHKVVSGRSAYKLAQCYASLREVRQTLSWLDTAHKHQVHFSRKGLLADSHYQAIRHKWKLKRETKRFTNLKAERAITKACKKHKQGHTTEAITYINQALKLRPDMPDWYKLKAKFTLELEQYDLTKKLLYTEAKYRPFNKSEPYLSIADIYLQKGEIHKGIIWSLMAINEDSLQLSIMPYIAELYILDNQYNQAQVVLNKYLTEVPVDHYAHFLKALLAEDLQIGIWEINMAISLSKQQTASVPQKYYDILSELSMQSSQ
jgi:tetratricopeptide (TPR) repeat protein